MLKLRAGDVTKFSDSWAKQCSLIRQVGTVIDLELIGAWCLLFVFY